jgi:hypothetical protein
MGEGQSFGSEIKGAGNMEEQGRDRKIILELMTGIDCKFVYWI